MKWLKRGLVWGPDQTKPWALSHAMCPTPIQIDDNIIRVYVSTLDAEGRGHATFVEVDANDPTIVRHAPDTLSLGPGESGAFDDNGVVALGVIKTGDRHLMYYAGFELCTQIRYRIFTGLAISDDGGRSFNRHSKVPVLDRSDKEMLFRCGPFPMIDKDEIRLWYVGGDRWTDIDGKSMPVYDLRHVRSQNGISWPQFGDVVMSISGDDEHGFGRPWVVKQGEGSYQLFYSIRRRSLKAYRLGYAESSDGLNWICKDEKMGLDVTPGGFDSDAIMYSAVITVADKTYCFYNGNDFGKEGFALAELVE
ncbi:glucosyl hydrolase [Rhizobium sp. AN69]|uniref:glucosyl hydrolase n=1 Tax=Rhizobium sp. AN69 TaxID=3035213 RepID=UPI002B25C42E|nr:glucosyl hydrolase [Rhizobium sp. AN69]